MSLEKICLYYSVSRNQREQELARGEDLEGTKNYEIIGCYKCDGYKFECPAYTQKIISKNYK